MIIKIDKNLIKIKINKINKNLIYKTKEKNINDIITE